MLPYVLAIAVGASSSVLFLTAFFLKDIHRQDDFFWSGIGLFYALVLWFCATSITGAVLLGQLAAVALLLAYFWQVIKLRGAIANPEKIDSLDSFSVVSSLNKFLGRSPNTVDETSNPVIEKEKPSFPLTTVKKETVAEAPSDSDTIVETNAPLSIQEVTPVSATSTTPEPDSSIEEKTFSTAKEDTAATSSPATIPPQTPEEELAPTEPKTTEITVETATIVEEDTNWADEDEVEDIAVSDVKVIEESPSPSESEPQTTIEVADSQSEARPTNNNPESKPNQEA